MHTRFRKLVMISAALLIFSGNVARAAVITQWSFNSTVARATSGTQAVNSPAPSTGVGTAITLGMSGYTEAGGTDTFTADDVTSSNGALGLTEFAWRIRGNINGWATYRGGTSNGAPQYTQGIQLNASTVGYNNINFNFDWFSTTQGVRDLQFQYNLNASAGSASTGWVNFGGTSPTGTYIANPNDFYAATPPNISINLASIPGAANDPNFGIRLVSAFDSTGHLGNEYASATLATGVTQIYNNSSGNWRFDNLSFSGNLGLVAPIAPALTWNLPGTGTWNTTDVSWLDSGSNPTAYSDGNNVVFGAVTSGTNAVISIAGSGAGGSVSPTGITINNTTAGTGYTFGGGAISGSGVFYISSANVGFVSLTGSNSYTGGTQVSGGTLIVNSDRNLGIGGALVLDNNSTLQLAATGSGLASGRLIEIGSNGGTIDTSGLSASTSGSFVAGGNFTKIGSGTITLNGPVVQFSGSTSISGGNLVLSGTNAASFQNGATFNSNLVISGASRVNFDNSGNGVYGGPGQIQITASGTVTTNTASSNNWVVISNSPSGSSTAAGGTVTSGGTISNNISLNPGGNFTKGNVVFTPSAGYSLNTGNTFLVGFGGTTTGSVLAITGNISGNSDVVLGSNSNNGSGGSGTLYLSGSNTYAGTTIVDGNGTIQLGRTNTLPIGTDVIFGVTDSSGASVDLNGYNQRINSLSQSTGSGFSITNSNTGTLSTLTISGSTTPTNGYAGKLTGNLALFKSGTSTLFLSGSSTYTGGTEIAGGALIVSKSSATGSGPLTIDSGVSLSSSGSAVTIASSLTTLGTNASLSPAGIGSLGTLAFNSLNLSASTNINYDLSLNQDDLVTGSGTLSLTGSNIFVNLNNLSSTIFTPIPLFKFAGGISGGTSALADFHDGSTPGHTWTFSLSNSGTEVDLNITGYPTFASPIWATTSGSWDLTSANWTVSGSTGKTYIDGNAVTFPEPSANSVVTIVGSGVAPSVLTISSSAHSYTFQGGPINGSTGLFKSNNGVVTLSSSNGYTGGTFVTGGTLIVNGGDNRLGDASGGVTIDNGAAIVTQTTGISSSRSFSIGSGGATLDTTGGSSTIGGSFSIAAGGAFTKVGTNQLTLTGNVSAATGAVINAAQGDTSILIDNVAHAGTGATNNMQLNIASSATVTLHSASSSTLEQAYGGVYNGNLVAADPMTLSFAGGSYTGSGAIQFQNMQTFPVPTHFSNTTANVISAGGSNATQQIDVNIQLNTLPHSTWNRTSITQPGGVVGGTSFVLGNGTTDSFTAIDPGGTNTLKINGVISGDADVQFGPIGGGGQGGTVEIDQPATYTGVTIVEFGKVGTIRNGVDNALPTTTDLMFAPINGDSYQQHYDLNGKNQTIASLSVWTANITQGIQVLNNNVGTVSTLTVSGAVTPSRAFSGVLSDNGGLLALVKDGPNSLVLTGSNNGYTGGTTVAGGLLLLAPGNSSINSAGFGGVHVTGGTLQGVAKIGDGFQPASNEGLTVESAGTVYPGIPGQPGTLNVTGSAGFNAGSNLIYDFAASGQSLLNVGDVLSLPGSGHVTVNVNNLGGLVSSATGTVTVPLIDAASATIPFNVSELALGSHPLNYTFSFSSSSSGGSAVEIDLVATKNSVANLTWTGSNGSTWDTAVTPNFKNGGSVSVMYPSDNVTFDDTARTGSISVFGTVAPGSMTFSNSALAYSISGSGIISGTGGLLVNGGGSVTLSTTDTYTGPTTVASGKLVLNGASSLLAGSTLVIGAPSPGSVFQTPSAAVASGQGAATVAPVPEPGTFALLAVATLAGIGFVRRKRQAKAFA